MNGGPIAPQDNTSTQIHNHSSHITNRQLEVDDECLDVTTQLPPPKLASMKAGTTRPTSMQRRISVGLPTHLRLQGKGYGIPAARKANFAPSRDATSRKWITSPEVFSSILVALPYVFVFVLNNRLASNLRLPNPSPIDQSLEIQTNALPTKPAVGHLPLPTLCVSFAVATGTLILCGFVGMVQQIFTSPDRRKDSLKSSQKRDSPAGRGITLNTRRIVEKLSAVALPFYAASILGGARVTLIILLAISSKILTLEDGGTTLTTVKGWKELLQYRRWTLASILAQALYDFARSISPVGNASFATGYLALVLSIFALPPPFPSIIRVVSGSEEDVPSASGSVVLSSGFETPQAPGFSVLKKSTISPLISSPEETVATFLAGGASAALCMLTLLFSNIDADAFHLPVYGWYFLTCCTASTCLLVAQPKSLQENKGLGILTGAVLSSVISYLFDADLWRLLVFQGGLIALSFLATQIDAPTVISSIPKAQQPTDPGHNRAASHSVHSEGHSRITGALLGIFQHRPLLHSILVEKDSRRIFYFMSLNFAFMLVQLFYGVATGSLGLLSDSIHMFFDCLALIVGLCAAVMSKWPPSPRFPYGYGKIDTLAGFANGIFLMLISLEIIYEALERLVEGSEMQRLGELLTVSTLGLLVNLVGVTAFGHAHHGHSHGPSHGHLEHDHSHHDHSHHDHSRHDHSHHDHSQHDHSHHDHSHRLESHDERSHIDTGKTNGNHDHGHPESKVGTAHDQHHHQEHDGHLHGSPSPSPWSSVPPTPSKPDHSHSHACETAPHHHHGHGNENMHGIYLHVLADTLGSVAVVVSTLLIHFYKWSGFDPLASCLIAILIFASAVPLVQSTAKKLLLTIPEDVEFDLREALAGVSALKGVIGYAAPKFWLDEGNERKVIGVIHITAGKGADLEDVKERAVAFLKSRRMDVLVQVERDGVSRCWCKAKTG
ncbi:MAG: hypothetical protein Q9193_001655 [Seirophora villosa]